MRRSYVKLTERKVLVTGSRRRNRMLIVTIMQGLFSQILICWFKIIPLLLKKMSSRILTCATTTLIRSSWWRRTSRSKQSSRRRPYSTIYCSLYQLICCRWFTCMSAMTTTSLDLTARGRTKPKESRLVATTSSKSKCRVRTCTIILVIEQRTLC